VGGVAGGERTVSIVATEIESIHGSTTGRHLVFYRCQDSDGKWHPYGPVIAEPGFDIDGHKDIAASVVLAGLVNDEMNALLGE
jgi:hypothetical protein